MKTVWIILAGACGVLAVIFVFQNDYEKAFVAAAGGAVCWFLNYRQQLRDNMPEEAEEIEEEDDESDEEVRS